MDEILNPWISLLERILPDHIIARAEAMVGDGAVRPSGPFVTVKIISGPNDYTIDEVQTFNSQNILEMFTIKNYILSLQVFRKGALDAITLVKTQLRNPDNVDFLHRQANVAVTNRGGVTDLSQQFATGFEERFQCDISFSKSFTAKTKVGTIERVGDIRRG